MLNETVKTERKEKLSLVNKTGITVYSKYKKM